MADIVSKPYSKEGEERWEIVFGENCTRYLGDDKCPYHSRLVSCKGKKSNCPDKKNENR